MQVSVPGAAHVQSLQPSPDGHVIPSGQRAPLGSVHAVEAIEHAPMCWYGRSGQLELALNVTPSHPQNGARSAVHARPSRGPHTQGTAQPGPPWHSSEGPQSDGARQVRGASTGGRTSTTLASRHALAVHATAPWALHEQMLQPSGDGQVAPTSQLHPPGIVHRATTSARSLDTSAATSLAASLAASPGGAVTVLLHPRNSAHSAQA